MTIVCVPEYAGHLLLEHKVGRILHRAHEGNRLVMVCVQEALVRDVQDLAEAAGSELCKPMPTLSI